MNAQLALLRYKSYAGAYRAYSWTGRLSLRKFMAAGLHKINPWLSRYDGCATESYP